MDCSGREAELVGGGDWVVESSELEGGNHETASGQHQLSDVGREERREDRRRRGVRRELERVGGREAQRS